MCSLIKKISTQKNAVKPEMEQLKDETGLGPPRFRGDVLKLRT